MLCAFLCLFILQIEFLVICELTVCELIVCELTACELIVSELIVCELIVCSLVTCLLDFDETFVISASWSVKHYLQLSKSSLSLSFSPSLSPCAPSSPSTTTLVP